jgi:hypothetical protein
LNDRAAFGPYNIGVAVKGECRKRGVEYGWVITGDSDQFLLLRESCPGNPLLNEFF